MTEMMGTAMLLLVALLVELQPRHMPEALRPVFTVCLQPFLISTCVVVLIAGLGGPTAYAANPARDLGPRLAHALLPIPNKGSSELLSYAWVPFFGSLAGGALAGALYIAIEALIFPGGGVEGCVGCAFAGA
jgi:glycerol uptake facilitator protein